MTYGLVFDISIHFDGKGDPMSRTSKSIKGKFVLASSIESTSISLPTSLKSFACSF